MKKDKLFKIITIVLCSIVVIGTVISCISGIAFGPEGAQPGSENMTGLGFFKAFTVLSNVYAGIAALIVAIYALINLVKKQNNYPKWLMIAFLAAVDGVMMTFLVTVFFLGPQFVMKGQNYFKLFAGNLFFLHFLDPLLCILVMMFFINRFKFNWKHYFFGIVPVFLYSCVYAPMVLSGTWKDFYGFTFGGKYYLVPLVLVVVYGLGYLFAFIVGIVHNRFVEEK